MRGFGKRTPLVSWLFLLALFASPLTVTDVRAQTPSSDEGSSAGRSSILMADLARAAVEHFRSQRYEEALAGFEAALPLAQSDSERATLELNRASCLFELGRYEEAKARFLAAASLDPSLSTEARLNAAASALRAEDFDTAQDLIASTRTTDPALSQRRSSLASELRAAEQGKRRSTFLGHIRTAEAALSASDHRTAKARLSLALKYFDLAKPAEQVDVLYGLGVSLLEIGDPAGAKAVLERALALSPDDADVHYALGRTLNELGDDQGAERHLERSLKLGLDPQRARSATSMLGDLDPLPPAGWNGSVALGMGYDTNPGQSGVATVSSLGNQSRGGSAYGTAVLDFGRTERLSRRLSGRLYYAGDWLGLWQRPVRELTLQSHSAGARLDWASSPSVVFRFDLAPSFAVSGLSELEPFVWEVLAGARTDVRTSDVGWARAGFQVRQIGGFSGWEYLSGTRLDAELSHAWHGSLVDLRLGGRGRYNAIGTRVSTVEAGAIAACAGFCVGADYQVPLGYLGVGPFVNLGVEPLQHLWIWGYASGDYRSYLEDSVIVGVEASRKRREDLRGTFEVRVELPLDEEGAWHVVPGYGLLVSVSNVAYDATDPDHAYDYDDRNFVQHFAEINLEATF